MNLTRESTSPQVSVEEMNGELWLIRAERLPSGLVILRTEIEYFEQERERLALSHHGKFALVKGQELIGIFDTDHEAYREGIRQFGIQPFMIREIAAPMIVPSILSPQIGR